MKNQQGFTLIELIMVIVILGILAAVALPKFVNLKSDAVSASANGSRGAINSAATIAHSKFLVAPLTTSIEGVPVAYVNGYPDTATIGPLAGITTTDYTTVATGAAATANSPATTGVPAKTAFIPASVAGTISGLTCYVMYTEAAAGGAPTVAIDASGC